MYKTIEKDKPNTIAHTTLLLLITLLLYIGTLNATGSSKIGIFALGISIILSGLNFIVTVFRFQRVKILYLIFLLIAFLYVVIGIFSGRDGSLTKEIINPLQFVACIIVLCTFSELNMTTSRINKLFWISTIFVLFHFGLWITQGLPSHFQSIYLNSNLVGPYMFIAIFFILLKIICTRRLIIAIGMLFISMLILLASDTRSVLLSMFVGLLVYMSWRVISRNLISGTLFFGVFIAFIFSIIFLYPNLPKWKYYSSVELWMRENTGKSLMSGRAEIWSSLNDYIAVKPFFGYGPSTVASDLIGRQASSHNLYMNIALQMGLVGLLLFIILLYLIFVIMIGKNQSRISRLSAAFYIAILTHQIFEITLIQNQLSIGIFQWAIIGIGLTPMLSNNKMEDFDTKHIKLQFENE